jgi:aspartate dehydrogenase
MSESRGHRIGIIGCGGIAELVLTTLRREIASPFAQLCLLVNESSANRAHQLLDRVGRLAESTAVRTDISAFLADAPTIVAECASHSAVRNYGPDILRAGCDLVVISIGALADDGLRQMLVAAAEAGGGRLILPPGAIGGIDALAAAKLSGLESVVYTGRKPPKAWRGTPAERLVALDSLAAPAVFFEGSARKAAAEYPFNANVAAALALAGIGFDATKVRLVADPAITRNVHEFAVSAGCGDFSIRLEGRPSPANPKTSLMAGYSVARELINRTGHLAI